MHARELPEIHGMVSFLNPIATGYNSALAREALVHAALLPPGSESHTIITEPATPGHIREYGNRQWSAVYSDGGDGIVNLTVAAMIGHVRDDPEATAQNFAAHASLTGQLLYVAGAGGNANNFALSALGSYAQKPGKISQVHDLVIGLHRPMTYTVVCERGDIKQSGIATSCFGINATAAIQTELEGHRTELTPLGPVRRLAVESDATFRHLMQVQPFDAELSIASDRDTATETLSNVTGFEMIGSRIYAKRGRTQTNIDRPEQQIVITHRRQRAIAQLGTITALAARLSTGRHARPLVDFTNTTMSLRLTSDAPVPFHTDGEVRPAIEPGQTLRLRLAQLVVPVLMRQ